MLICDGDICNICCNEDFGYCSLRNVKEEVKYKYDKKGKLIKCSGFMCDKSVINKIFKLTEVKI